MKDFNGHRNSSFIRRIDNQAELNDETQLDGEFSVSLFPVYILYTPGFAGLFEDMDDALEADLQLM